jgi:hypothetical protein
MISGLHCTSSTQVMLNGLSGQPIHHWVVFGRGSAVPNVVYSGYGCAGFSDFQS